MSAEPHAPASELSDPDLPPPPRIVVPPELAEAVRAYGTADLVAEDGRPLLTIRPERDAEQYARALATMSPEEERALFERYENYDGPTSTLEEILAGLPKRPTAEAA